MGAAGQQAAYAAQRAVAVEAVRGSVNLLTRATLPLPDAVRSKPDGAFRDVVTPLDEQVEEYILRRLEGEQLIVAEETRPDALANLTGESYWAIDPIDGTANYAAGLPIYATTVGSVAPLTSSPWKVGAVGLPAMREIFSASEGFGAYLNGERLHHVASASLETSLVGASFSGKARCASSRREEYSAFGLLNDMSRGNMRLGSAAASICYVAAGRLQAAYGCAVRVWDVAGALAVAAEAGYTVHVRFVDAKTGTLHFVVGVPHLVDELVEILERAMA